MSLKDFGWETYRVRSHSIPPSLANTDTYHSCKRRISKSGAAISSPRKSVSLQVTPPQPSLLRHELLNNTTKHDLNEPNDITPSLRLNLDKDSISSDVKSKRSLTMPTTISINSNDKLDVRHGKNRSIF